MRIFAARRYRAALCGAPRRRSRKTSAFDHFAPVSGKRVAMIVAGPDYTQLFGKHSTVYVNLGSNQSVRMGDYFRIFRYQGTLAEAAPQTKDYQYEMYGFGSTHEKYAWKDLPREVLGEGIVINRSAQLFDRTDYPPARLDILRGRLRGTGIVISA